MKVNTTEMERQVRALRNAANRIHEIQNSVLRISRNIRAERFGERFTPALNAAVASVGNRGEELGRLREALAQIASVYEQTEVRVLEEAESASIHFLRLPTRLVVIPGWVPPPAPIIIDGLFGQTETGTQQGASIFGGDGLIDWTPWNP